VWPALWPPWKRTTTSARSDSQSTIFPLPSSPHCEPTTTTLAMNYPSSRCCCAAEPGERQASITARVRLRNLSLPSAALSRMQVQRFSPAGPFTRQVSEPTVEEPAVPLSPRHASSPPSLPATAFDHPFLGRQCGGRQVGGR